VADSKVLRAAGSRQVVDPSGKYPAGVGSLGETEQASGRIEAIASRRSGRDVDRPGAGFKNPIGDKILWCEVSGVGSAAARGQSDVVTLRSAIAPVGKCETRIRTPRKFRRIDVDGVR